MVLSDTVTSVQSILDTVSFGLIMMCETFSPPTRTQRQRLWRTVVPLLTEADGKCLHCAERPTDHCLKDVYILDLRKLWSGEVQSKLTAA